jgi:hypothetical protein
LSIRPSGYGDDQIVFADGLLEDLGPFLGGRGDVVDLLVARKKVRAEIDLLGAQGPLQQAGRLSQGGFFATRKTRGGSDEGDAFDVHREARMRMPNRVPETPIPFKDGDPFGALSGGL